MSCSTISTINKYMLSSAGAVPSIPRTLSVSSTTSSSVTIAFSAPLLNGGSPITSYTISNGLGASYSANSLSLTLSSLVGGTTYTISIYATNAIGNSISATISASTLYSYPTGPFSKGSIYCNGSSQYALSATNSNLNLNTSNYTIEFWFYCTSSSANSGNGIIAGGGSVGGAWRFFFDYPGYAQKITFQGMTNNCMYASNTQSLNAWHHVAVCSSYGSTFNMYVDGILQGTYSPNTYALNNCNQFVIGRDYTTLSQEYLTNCYITNIRISTIAMYSGTNTSSANFTVPTTALLTYQNASTNILSMATSQCVLLLTTSTSGGMLTDLSNNAISFTNYSTSFSSSSPFANG
jgi:hypothetical protein